MPTFYNTTLPTPNSKNTINSIAVTYGIRDFLLNKNLTPVYPQLSTSLNGSPKIGEPVLDTMVGDGNVVQPFGLPLESEGILRMEIAVLPNRYKKQESTTTDDLVSIDYIQQTVGPYPNSTPTDGIGIYPNELERNGLLNKTEDASYRKNATIKNLYLDVDKQVDAADWVTLESIPTSQQIDGYLDVYGGLNLGGGPAVPAANVIGSVLNGQGIGLAKGGIVTNFDLRASLAGRVLGATGLLNDTKLGVIGGQQLALALANNAAFNVQQAVLGKLNVQDNILSLVKDGTLAGFRPNYQITIPSGDGGRVLDYTARILGFTLPKSFLADAGSIFLSESNSDNINRANSMILNTGKGQVVALIKNMNANLIGTTQNDNPDTTPFRSGYAPGFKDNRGNKAINPQTYAFGDADGIIYNFLINNKGVIPEISYNRSGMINQYGFTGPEDNVGAINPYADSTIRKPTFTWGSDIGNGVNNVEGAEQFVSAYKKKSLLAKTQLLFNDIGMKNIVSTKGQMNIVPSQIQTAVVGYGISKGNAVMKASNFSENGIYNGTSAATAEDTYCRSWTTLSRYEKVQNLVRSSGLSTIVPYRNQMNGSVLDEYGFPKIAPYSTDKPDDPKKFMFSIENLAWSDQVENLLPCEIGPGDLISGKRGRIMWFPPYNIQFTENSNVNWETNNFVGRGESIYTYNNTERSGTLSFQIIVDHPSYINSFKGSDGPDDHYVASFFAGCVDPTSKFADKLTVSEFSSLSTENLTKPQEKVDPTQQPPLDTEIEVFFPNDVFTYVPEYENGLCGTTPIDYNENPTGLGCGIGNMKGQVTSNTEWTDRYNFGYNSGSGKGKMIVIDNVGYSGFSDSNLITALNTYLNEKCPKCVVKASGYASVQGNVTANNSLARKRAETIINMLKPLLHTNITGKDKDARFVIDPNSKPIEVSGCIPGNNEQTDNFACKSARKVGISFTYNSSLEPNNDVRPEPVVVGSQTRRVSNKITNRFYTECNYFEQLTDKDYFVFDKFREKIKYFHPAFHSTTPEGLNSRLTFLHQCTRQGPTLESQGANNLAFGRPPVCILRIGDFYNTKIIMESINIDYEPLVWDLNPEGIGVQPMIANVNISFKFIGGSTLLGPINKLQNALSFNYYANTQVYDVRADYISKDRPNIVTKDKNGNPITKQAPLSDYYITDGFKGNMNEQISVDVTQGEIVSQTPILDQMLANDNATNGLSAQQQAQPIDDKNVISKIALQSYYNIQTSDNTMKLSFRFNQTKDLPFNLDSTTSKIYKGQIYLMSTTNVSKKDNIGYVTVKSNGSNNGVIFGAASNVTYDVVVDKNVQTPWNVFVPLTDSQITLVNNALSETGSSIVVEWETGSKSSMIFSSNTAL